MEGDLTTVDRAKAWLAPDQGFLTSQNDALISRLVTAVSRLAMNYMGRDTLARTVRSETYRGSRTGVLLLRQWPVISVASMIIGPSTTALAADDYSLEPIRPAGGSQRIYLARGRTFISPGDNGIAVSYVSGFVKTERLVVGSDLTVTTGSTWLQDEGVKDNAGAAVTGYTVAAGKYTLPSGMDGQEVDVTYSYAPEDIEQAVIQEVGMLVKSRSHIGEASKALPQGAGTTSYLPITLSPITQAILASYRRVVPQ